MQDDQITSTINRRKPKPPIVSGVAGSGELAFPPGQMEGPTVGDTLMKLMQLLGLAEPERKPLSILPNGMGPGTNNALSTGLEGALREARLRRPDVNLPREGKLRQKR